MNYQKIYSDLISRAILRHTEGYYESHHIIPRCIGGTDDESNLVRLTPEEHYVAHQLLAKIYPNHYGLTYAAVMMCANRPTNKLYGWIRRRLSEKQTEIMKNGGSPTQDKRWISNENESLLVDQEVANLLVLDKKYIYGKKAKIADCGHLIRERCMKCEDLISKRHQKRKEDAKVLAHKLYENFMNSEHDSITAYASANNTSQPRLSMLWKKYVPEYQEKCTHGVSLKSKKITEIE